LELRISLQRRLANEGYPESEFKAVPVVHAGDGYVFFEVVELDVVMVLIFFEVLFEVLDFDEDTELVDFDEDTRLLDFVNEVVFTELDVFEELVIIVDGKDDQQRLAAYSPVIVVVMPMVFVALKTVKVSVTRYLVWPGTLMVVDDGIGVTAAVVDPI
jgi:hypothetical protein